MTSAGSVLARRFGAYAALLLAGDLAWFLIFALIGLHSHDEALTVRNLVRASGLFWLTWLAAATMLGLYQSPGAGSTSRVLGAWAIAWVAGLAARAALFDRSPRLGFAVVSLAFVGLALVVWRALAARFLASSAD